ncbi:MAG TPA: NAD(P)H-hydrate dehydratase [Gammaproteobacteria bacterium]|jgi:NAD(P)H-hydrate epimerase
MSALPENLFTVPQLRELERRAMEDARIPTATLMQRAGEAAWQALKVQWPGAAHLLVLCGAGSNAGDGYVLANRALKEGLKVTVLTLGDRLHLPQAASDMRGIFLKAGGSERGFEGRLPAADVIVDALLGIGIDRQIHGEWLKLVKEVNACGTPVLSIDVPTGLNADSGAEMGTAIRADLTITYIALKAGLFTGAGPECSGLLRFDNLQVPPNVYGSLTPRARRLRSAAMRETGLMPRRRDANKGDFGRVLIVGGDHGMSGAVRLSAEAALRSGAGLVTIATQGTHLSGLLAGVPEALGYGIETADDLKPLLEKASVVAVGPGLGKSHWGRMLLKQVMAADLPLVVDADALNILAEAPHKHGRWILTPHPGEAGRLLGTDTATIQRDRYACVERIAERFDAVTVLKGAGSLVAAHGEVTAVCTAGNPGMAAPGMGDVLTGVIAALVGQGLPLAEAARQGVYVHAAAGDLAARQGERGLMARDLMEALRRLVNV